MFKLWVKIMLWSAAAGLFVLPAGSAGAKPASCVTPYSWVAGTTDLCRGTLVYHDYVYDDYGADTGQISSNGTLAPPAGDDTNPDDINSADLVSLQLRLVKHRLVIRAVLNDLIAPRSTLLGITIGDGDGDEPGGRWGPLDVSSQGWEKLIVLRSGNPASHVITGSVPAPEGRVWRIQAATALASNGKVMNVAFRGPDEQARFIDPTEPGDLSDHGLWFEDKQAAALKTGDITQFAYTVNVSDLRHRLTRLAQVGPGLHERVYTSAYPLPPGAGYNATGVPQANGENLQLVGRYQPYGIYIPHGSGPFGLQFVYHGNASNFPALINEPGMQQAFGENLHRLLVVPSARGPFGGASPPSERDELDVLADVERTYPVDRDRVFASGYSLGAKVAPLIAELHPDLFAGVVTWSGPTGAPVLPLLENLRRIPTAILFGGADELNSTQAEFATQQAFASSDDIYTFYYHPAAEHLTFAILDNWQKEAAYTKNLTLVHNPPRVSYRTTTSLDGPAFGIVHDHAYWISAIRGRQTGTVYEDVDLTTQACGGSVPTTTTGNGAGTDPVPWVSWYRQQTGLSALPRAPKLTGTLTNITSLRLDAKATCLRQKTFAYDITTDGTTTIRLSDRRTLKLTGSGPHEGTLRASPGVRETP